MSQKLYLSAQSLLEDSFELGARVLERPWDDDFAAAVAVAAIATGIAALWSSWDNCGIGRKNQSQQ